MSTVHKHFSLIYLQLPYLDGIGACHQHDLYVLHFFLLQGPRRRDLIGNLPCSILHLGMGMEETGHEIHQLLKLLASLHKISSWFFWNSSYIFIWNISSFNRKFVKCYLEYDTIQTTYILPLQVLTRGMYSAGVCNSLLARLSSKLSKSSISISNQ